MGLRGSHDLRSRGATHIDLLVTDGHDGLLAAVSEQFTATPRQRCLVHKQRNVLNAIPRRERGDVQAERCHPDSCVAMRRGEKDDALTLSSFC